MANEPLPDKESDASCLKYSSREARIQRVRDFLKVWDQCAAQGMIASTGAATVLWTEDLREVLAVVALSAGVECSALTEAHNICLAAATRLGASANNERMGGNREAATIRDAQSSLASQLAESILRISCTRSAIKASWAFIEAALLKEHERMAYPEGMFPQVRDEIRQSRRNLLDAIDSVRFAKERGMPLPTAEEVAKCETASPDRCAGQK